VLSKHTFSNSYTDGLKKVQTKWINITIQHMTACRSVDTYQRFEGTCCSHFKTNPTFMPLPTFLRWRRKKFLRNVSTWHYTASYQKIVQVQRPTRLDGAREDKTGIVTYKGSVGGAFVTPLLTRKINKYCIFRVWVCGLSYTATNAHAPYYTVTCGLSRSAVFFHGIS